MKKILATPGYEKTHPYPTGELHAAKLTELGYTTFLFDFDETLIKTHFYRDDVEPLKIQQMSDPEFAACFNDRIYVADLLRAMTTLHAVAVYIVSFGREDVIQATLARPLYKDGIDHADKVHIYTPLTKGLTGYTKSLPRPENKNELILKVLYNRAPNTTLYVEDDTCLITAAKNRFPEIHTIHVKNTRARVGISAALISEFITSNPIVTAATASKSEASLATTETPITPVNDTPAPKRYKKIEAPPFPTFGTDTTHETDFKKI